MYCCERHSSYSCNECYRVTAHDRRITPEGDPGGAEEKDVGRITGLFPGGAGDTGGAPGDDGPCSDNWGRWHS